MTDHKELRTQRSTKIFAIDWLYLLKIRQAFFMSYISKAYKKVETLYEDEHIIVLNKPAGILSIPDRYNPYLPNLKKYLELKGHRPYVLHRIDRETSGLICFALNEEAHKEMSKQFNKRTIDKYYQAIIDGKPITDAAAVDLPIGENMSARGTMKVDQRYGKKASSYYKVLERFNKFSLVEVKIETGRMHQIRVHMKAIGHPLAVDSIYGKRDGFYLSEVKGSKRYNVRDGEDEKPLVSRITLHAWRLHFNHPVSGEKIMLEAPLMKDMNAMLKQLRKYDVLRELY